MRAKFKPDPIEAAFLIKQIGARFNPKPGILSRRISYGFLYNWYAVDNANGLAPEGWHVATDAEWTTLTTYIDSANDGNLLKSCRQVNSPTSGCDTSVHPRWDSHATEHGTNDYGFSGLPGGLRSGNSGLYTLVGSIGYWWTSTESDSANAWYRALYGAADLYRDNFSKKVGFSVRCIRDNDTGWVEGQQVKDIDGNTYDTVKIGTQIWMVQNLATKRYKNGVAIPIITDNSEWANDTVGAMCAYDNNHSYAFRDEWIEIPYYSYNMLRELVTPTADAWAAGTYNAGDQVTHSGIVYEATTTTTNEPPHADWILARYVPIGSHEDLHAVRTTYSGGSTRVFGAGTVFETAAMNTLGLADRYVQVRNIDLYDATRTGGAYDNGGEGWIPITTGFSGIYDGAGRQIKGLYINRPASQYQGLFGNAQNGDVRNLYIDYDITCLDRGGVLGYALGSAKTIENIITTGRIRAVSGTIGLVGGVVGSIGGLSTIKNCLNAATVHAISYTGGIYAANNVNGGYVYDCYNIGHIDATTTTWTGAIAGTGAIEVQSGSFVEVADCFYNNETSGIGVGAGNLADGAGLILGKTTAELLALTAATSGWSATDYDFNSNYYPVNKVFLKSAVHMPPPHTLLVEDDSVEGLLLKWTAPLTGTPDGYNVYKSVEEEAWEPANDALITTTQHHLANAGYGYLYNFYAIDSATNGGKSIAPTGWHVPTDAEWTALKTYLSTDIGLKLKSKRTKTGTATPLIVAADNPTWDNDANFGTNESGFTAYPGGYTTDAGSFAFLGSRNYFWSSTEYLSTTAFFRLLYSSLTNLARSSYDKAGGMSIRLIRTTTTGWTEGEQVTDADGNVYDTIKIGDQVWMLQNLVTTKYSDGTAIPNVTDATTWAALTTGAYCAYNNDESLAKIGDLGTMNLFVKAVYTKNGVESETGNSETTDQEITP